MKPGNSSLSLKRHAFCLVTAYLLVVSALSVLSPSIDISRATYPFSPDIMVSDSNETADQLHPDVAISPNQTIYVIWEDSRNDPNPESPPRYVDIFISASYNMGRIFSRNVQITDNSETLAKSEPSIAIDPEGTIYVAWWDHTGLYLQKSLDGVTFTEPVEVSTGISGTFKIAPSVCAPVAGKVYVAYSSPNDMAGRIFVAISSDGGANFHSTRVDDGGADFRTNPDIGADQGGNVYVVWQDQRNGDSDIYFSRSTNGGISFSPNVRVNDDNGNSLQELPSLALGKTGNIYVVWGDWRNGGSDIFFSKSTDGGASFGDGLRNDNDIQVDDYPLSAMHDHPVVAIGDSERILVSWRDTRNGLNDQDIYFTSSEDGGQTFGDGLRNNNDIKVNDDVDDTAQQIPAIAATPDGMVCVVWYDGRNFAEKGVDVYSSVLLGTAPDLVVPNAPTHSGPKGIEFDPQSPEVEGTLILITTNIQNLGNKNASNVVVRFFDDDMIEENQIGDDELIPFILRNGGFASVYKEWVCKRPGTHTIFVVADPDNDILELNEDNNIAESTFQVLSIANPARPENVGASLSGPLDGDVLIAWDLSPDDVGGRQNVDRYDIYRGLYFDEAGSGYQLIDTVPRGIGIFSDHGAGHGDPSDYFYVVCAYNSTHGRSCSLTQGAKINKPVREGWNLLTTPLFLQETNLEAVFKTIDLDIVRKYDPESSWESYYSFKYENTLRDTDAWSGYWVHCLQEGNFTIAGRVPQEIELLLRAGWNLIALPSFATDVYLYDLLVTYPIRKAEMFDPSSPPYFLREMYVLEVFFPENGYWVEALEDCTITMQNI